MHRYLIGCLVLATMLAVTGCGEDDPAGPVPIVLPGENEEIIYSKHVQPIFTNSCGGSGCHLGTEEGGGLKLDNWERVMAGTKEFGAVVVPYYGAKSHLFQHVNIDTTLGEVALPTMPIGRDPLPMEQILTIRRWIDEGAKNDQGEVALAGADRPRVFVTCQDDDVVAAIDLATQRVMRYIDVGEVAGGFPESPHNIVFSPDGRFIYVNMIAAGLLEKYDARTFQKLGSVRVGSSPAQVAVTKDGSTLYVSNFDVSLNQLFINKVAAATMTVTDTIYDVGNAPHGVILSEDERFLYTTNALGDDISEIDLQTMEISRRILISPNFPLPPGGRARYEPYQGEIGPDGHTLWVTCRNSNDVRVIDLELGRVVDSIPVGTRPLIPRFTPDKREFWVSNRGSDNISIIDPMTRRVVTTIRDIQIQPHAVDFTADGSLAFVSCENLNGERHHGTLDEGAVPGLVYVIDVATRKVIRKIEVGSFAAGITVQR